MSYIWLIGSQYHPPTDPLDTTIGNVVDIDMAALMPNRKVAAVRVRQAMVPNISFTVMPSNQSFIFTILDNTQTITIPLGYYTRDALLVAVNTALTGAVTAPDSAVFTYNARTFTARIAASRGGVAQPFSLDLPPLVPPATYRDAPSIMALMGIDDRVLPITYDPLTDTGPIANPAPINSDADRYALITCDQAQGLRGTIESFAYQASPPRMPWHNGIVAVFPLPLPKGEISQYFPGDAAQWVQLVRGDANTVIRFRLSRDRYEYFGPTAIYWSMLLELWLA